MTTPNVSPRKRSMICNITRVHLPSLVPIRCKPISKSFGKLAIALTAGNKVGDGPLPPEPPVIAKRWTFRNRSKNDVIIKLYHTTDGGQWVTLPNGTKTVPANREVALPWFFVLSRGGPEGAPAKETPGWLGTKCRIEFLSQASDQFIKPRPVRYPSLLLTCELIHSTSRPEIRVPLQGPTR
jgi:hypothetical protein